MLKYILKRLLMLIPTMLGIALLVLFIIDLTPGDPARMLLGTNATEEQVDYIIEQTAQVVEYLRSFSPVWRELTQGKRQFIL